MELTEVTDILLVLRVKAGGNVGFKGSGQLLLTIGTFPASGTGIMCVAVAYPIGRSCAKGLYKPGKRRIAAADNDLVQQILAWKAAVCGRSGLFEFRVGPR